MEHDEYSECEKDSEGNLLDCITCDTVPIDRAVVVKEGNGSYCFDIDTLLSSVIISGDDTNPFTRTTLPLSVQERVEEYRISTVKMVTVLDTRVAISAHTRLSCCHLDKIDKFGDLLIKSVSAIQSLTNLLRFDMSVEGVDIQSTELDTVVSGVLRGNRVVVKILSLSDSTTPLGEKLRKFVADNSRYSNIQAMYATNEDLVLDTNHRRTPHRAV